MNMLNTPMTPSEAKILATYARYRNNEAARERLIVARTFRRALRILNRTERVDHAKIVMQIVMRDAALEAVQAAKGGAA